MFNKLWDWGWGDDSVVECLPNTHEGLIPNSSEREREGRGIVALRQRHSGRSTETPWTVVASKAHSRSLWTTVAFPFRLPFGDDVRGEALVWDITISIPGSIGHAVNLSPDAGAQISIPWFLAVVFQMVFCLWSYYLVFNLICIQLNKFTVDLCHEAYKWWTMTYGPGQASLIHWLRWC